MAFKNRTKGTVAARQVKVAGTFWSRLVGLLNRSRLDPDEGLWICPSSGIHTWGMRFPIDVVFLGKMSRRVCRVQRIYHRLAPWRMTRLVWSAESVLELPAGAAEMSRIEVGDELEIVQD